MVEKLVDAVTAYPDERRRYCRRLGHEVPFHYCRLTDTKRVCSSIAGCWGADPAVRPCLDSLIDETGAATAPREKTVQLYELIRRAREAPVG